MYVCVIVGVASRPAPNAIARIIALVVTLIGVVYGVPCVGVGSVPSSVYWIVAPGVGVESVTEIGASKYPCSGLKETGAVVTQSAVSLLAAPGVGMMKH